MNKLTNYALFILIMGMTMTSCDKDDENGGEIKPVEVTNGLYIINEGNYYNQIDGSLSYLDLATDSVTNNLFASVNGRALGATPNHSVINGNDLYIACTDENLIEIVNKKTLIAGLPVKMTQPREMVAYDGVVYVTSYDGCVYKIENGAVAKKSEKVGACLEGITAVDGKIYVCNAYNPDYTYNTNVVVLDTALNKLSDITVACNPISILNDGESVYVLSNGNYADVQPQIQKISKDGKAAYLCEGSQMAYYNGKLYIIASSYDANWQLTTTYNVFDLKTGVQSTFTEGKEVEYPSAINVNPTSGEVYISSLHISEYGYGDYNNPGYLLRYSADGKFIRKYDVGVSPNTLVFATIIK